MKAISKAACITMFYALFLLQFILSGCGGGSDGGVQSAVTPQPSADYRLEAGKSVDIKEDLTIRSAGSVTINGSIQPDGATGQNITIIAEKDIIIAGGVTAGQGKAESGGGTVTLESLNGSITLLSGAVLAAGDGGAGTSSSTGAGGNGGSVVLKAAKGTITIPDQAGVIRLGSGANGADLTGVTSATNRGGDAGGFSFDATQVVGLEYTEGVFEQELTDADGTVLAKKGDRYRMITSSKPFSGGNGGNAGSLSYDANSMVAAAARKSSDEYAELKINGAPGGDASSGKAGNGQNVELKGLHGAAAGQNGQSVVVDGGDGGNCGYGFLSYFNVFSFCAPGNGGNATAFGGKGAKGADPNGWGGMGGYAFAKGGTRGSAINIINLNSSQLGTSGWAYAFGGYGGDGGSGCGDIKAESAGYGGQGGSATAYPGYSPIDDIDETILPHVNATTIAQGGNGGNGGSATEEPGTGGEGGEAESDMWINGILHTLTGAANGKNGTNGALCPPAPPAPPKVPKAAEIPGGYTYLLKKTAINTCPETLLHHEYSGNTTMSASGTQISIPLLNYGTSITGAYNETTGTYSGTGKNSDGFITATLQGDFTYNALNQLQLTGTYRFDVNHSSVKCSADFTASYTKQP